MPKSTQRCNRAFKIAYLSEAQRILYAVTLTAFVHSWAIWVIERLIPSAYTVLMFFAALHRAGRYGYIGTAIAYDLLSPQIVKATARKCAPRTLKRGLAFLKALGLVELRPWTMPEQTIRVNGRSITVSAGTARVNIGKDRWATRQLRIVVLTDRAVALWDKATGSQADRVLAPLRTCAILAPNSPVEQVGKPTMLDQQSSEHVTMSGSRNSRFDSAPSTSTSSPLDGAEVEGNPTRPGCPGGPQTIEHRPYTLPPASTQVEPKRPTDGPARPAPGPGAAPSKPPSAGCSRQRPKIPRGAPKSYTLACHRILAELHRAIEGFSQRQADSIYDRARYELSREYPAGWPTSCDWAYWTGRWNDFQPRQRRFHMMRDILPLLKSPAAVTPCEPVRYREGTTRPTVFETGHAADSPQNLKTELVGYLSDLAGRFCGDD
jgi:hypothetical protein